MDLETLQTKDMKFESATRSGAEISGIVIKVLNTLFLFLGVKNLSKHTLPINSKHTSCKFNIQFLQIQHKNFFILVPPHNLDALQLSFSSQSPGYSLMLFFNSAQYFSCFF